MDSAVRRVVEEFALDAFVGETLDVQGEGYDEFPQRQITMPMKVDKPDDSGGESGMSDCLVQNIVGSKLRGREDVIIQGSSFVVENPGRRRGVE